MSCPLWQVKPPSVISSQAFEARSNKKMDTLDHQTRPLLRQLGDLNRQTPTPVLTVDVRTDSASPTINSADTTGDGPLDFSSKMSSPPSPEHLTSTPLAALANNFMANRNLPLPNFPLNGGNQDGIEKLQRLIKANQALTLGKIQVAAAAVASAKLPVVPPPPPPFPPMIIDSGSGGTELQKVNHESLQQYNHFRENMLRQITLAKIKKRRSSSDLSTNASMSTSEDERSMMSISSPGSPTSSLESTPQQHPQTSNPLSMNKRKRDEVKDEAYWERRKKNNEAAKRSRDARRAKEDEIAIRAAFLEQENVQLKWEVATLKTEAARLKSMLLSDNGGNSGNIVD